MRSSKRAFLWVIPVVLLFGLGFAAASQWDLAIDKALYAPQNPFAVVMEAVGWWPAFLPTILLAMLCAEEGRLSQEKRWRYPLGVFLAAAGLGGLCYTSYHYLQKRAWTHGTEALAGWLLLALGIALGVLAFWQVFHLGEGQREKLYFFALVGSWFMVANVLLINLLKNIWQRPRFDTMLAEGGNFTQFQPWYLPFGPGGSSFPSGHTANACGVLILVVLCDVYPSWRRHRKLVYLICWVYIGAMAFSRILIGRHFLSDTLAATGLVALLFFAIRHTQWYRRGVLRARAIPNEKPKKKED